MVAGASIFLIIILLPMLIMTGVGVFLIVASRRGRGRSYPACGACNYDLSGSVGSVPRCPECGADFKTVGITPPSGRRSTPMLISGIVLMILPAFGLGLVIFLATVRAAAPRPAPAIAPAPPAMPTTTIPMPTSPGDLQFIPPVNEEADALPAAVQDAVDAEIDNTD